MVTRSPTAPRSLAIRAQLKLGLSHRMFGQLLGVSGRTSERWTGGASAPVPEQLATMARHVYLHDPALAAEIAAAIGTSLEKLGIVQPAVPAAPTPNGPPPAELVDLVVCAAAETMDVSPRLIRPVLHAAFARARTLGLDMAAVEAALAPQVVPASKPRRKASNQATT